MWYKQDCSLEFKGVLFFITTCHQEHVSYKRDLTDGMGIAANCVGKLCIVYFMKGVDCITKKEIVIFNLKLVSLSQGESFFLPIEEVCLSLCYCWRGVQELPDSQCEVPCDGQRMSLSEGNCGAPFQHPSWYVCVETSVTSQEGIQALSAAHVLNTDRKLIVHMPTVSSYISIVEQELSGRRLILEDLQLMQESTTVERGSKIIWNFLHWCLVLCFVA